MLNLAFLSNCFSQTDSLAFKAKSQLIVKEDGKYRYDNSIYAYEELSYLLELYPESFKYYNRAITQKRWARRTCNFALVSGGLAVLIFYRADSIGFNNRSFIPLALTGAGMLLITSILLPVFLIQRVFKNKYRKKSISIFNQNEIIEKGYNSDSSYFQFRMTDNGAGLVYHF